MSTAHILIIDQDPDVSHQLQGVLSAQGHKLEQACDASGGLLQAVTEKFDLILLNVLWPERCGFEILKMIRKSRLTPVILLAQDNAEQERIKGFTFGADDYLVKPLSWVELGLRIQAILRRVCQLKDSRPAETELAVHGLYLNRHNLDVQVGDVHVEMTPVQFKLLWFLVAHQHEVLEKAYLHTLVLDKPYCRHDRSIDMHLSRIRRKLEQAGLAVDRLQTVHGRGYCFI